MVIRPTIAALPLSATLQANQAAAQRRAAGHRVLHMGFGQSPFPVHPLLKKALAAHAGDNRYEHVAGLASLREAALDYFARKSGLNAADYDLIVAPGSKLILLALQMAIAGDLLLPVPSWVSYAPQALMLGDRIIPVATQLSDDGFRIDPVQLERAIGSARDNGANPSKLILNSPNNPTGLCIPPADYADLAAVCARHDVVILSDEIYAGVTFDGRNPSIASENPAITAITTGLSKHLSLGGWRIGFGLIPRQLDGLYDALCAIASETWSSVATPVQHAAIVAVSDDPAIEDTIRRCTAIHAHVARYAARRLRAVSLNCAMPSGAFYLWPDFSHLAKPLARSGVVSSQDLADSLLNEHGVLTLAGSGFGAPAQQLCLRLSVCDYDGAAALSQTQLNPDADVNSFAPGVVAGCDAICQFVAAYA